MPLYDCMLLAKSQVRKEEVAELAARVGRRVFQRNGVVTEIKSFGSIKLGYGIKKRDGRHWQGQLMQMTFMVPPSFNKELQYLNKEDRLLRWLVVKHRNTLYGLENSNEADGREELAMLKSASKTDDIDKDDDEDEYEEDEEEVDVLNYEDEDEDEHEEE
ncbi:hypothetical protein LUZ60_010088 [Juncus effusus]|nr:hypothetical protein LUZ60_010088 [Juncus effusus]